MMQIGLLGFGTVGGGVYELTKARSDMRVTRVVCLDDVSLPDASVSRDFQDILNDPSIDTVVEAIGGLHPAREFVRAAILAGKNIVTSNKALVAVFYDELLPLAEQMGVKFRCTAAVGGGIGWLSELQRVRQCEQMDQVGGIMNGTCNYILHAMSELGLTYDQALKQAQGLGYAEANPTTDVDGIDTWHKLIISANVAFGVSLDREQVPVAGIRNIQAGDVEQFKAHGLTCKLCSYGRRENGEYAAWVQPTLYPQKALEANVPTNYNLITLVGKVSGRQSFYGQGAGRYPTAYNVVQDCVELLRGVGFYCPYGEKVDVTNTRALRYYVRGGSDDWLKANTAEVWGEAVVTAPVAVSEMHAWLKNHPDAFIAALES